MAPYTRGPRVLLFIVLDIIATIAIFFAASAFLASLGVLIILAYRVGFLEFQSIVQGVFVTVLDPSSVPQPFLWQLISSGPQLHGYPPTHWPPGIIFYSTFFTSFWIWLYGLSGLAVRFCKPFSRGVRLARRFFDIDDQPLRSLGFVSILLVAVGYVVLAIVVR